MSNPGAIDLAATVHAQFLEAGFADTATYRPRVGAVTAGVRVFVNRDNAALVAQGLDVRAGMAVLRVNCADVPRQPAQGDTIVVGVDNFTVHGLVYGEGGTDDAEWVIECRA